MIIRPPDMVISNKRMMDVRFLPGMILLVLCFHGASLLVVNAVLSFMQEHRAAGVVETLRRRLQVSARVLREASWQVIPARELVPATSSACARETSFPRM